MMRSSLSERLTVVAFAVLLVVSLTAQMVVTSGGGLSSGASISGIAVNTVLRTNSSGALAASLLTDNATNVTLSSGQLLLPNGTAGAPSMAFSASPSAGVNSPGVNQVALNANGTQVLLAASATLIQLGTGVSLQFGPDVALLRDAANILAVQNSTNAQTLRVYGTTTGPKYLSLSHDGTNANIDTPAAGGNLRLGGNASIVFPAFGFNTMIWHGGAGLTSGAALSGQILIGATGLAPALATLTADVGIGILNAINSITVQTAMFNAAGTKTVGTHVVQDTATLAAGTVTVTLTGSAVFTSATSYTCVADDDTAIAATRVIQNSGSSITINGTTTDVVRFICIGS